MRTENAWSARNFIQHTWQETHTLLKCVTDMYDFVKCVIQPTIHEFYVEEKTSQTIPNLLLKLMDRINFKGSSTNIRWIVKELGFWWEKTRKNMVVLIKKHNVTCMRMGTLHLLVANIATFTTFRTDNIKHRCEQRFN